MTELVFNPRLWVPVFANMALTLIVLHLNNSLSAWGIHLFCVGAMPLFLSLNLPGISGFVGVVFSGLLLDAAQPVPFGLYTAVFALTHVTIQYFRNRVHRENSGQFMLLAQGVNAVAFLAITLFVWQRGDLAAQFWIPAGVNFVVSALFLVFVAPWFLDLHTAALRLAFGIRIFDEDLR